MALNYPDLANHIPDRRMLSAEQIQPVTTTGTDTITTERTNHINLTNLFMVDTGAHVFHRTLAGN
jgi:hypothetical protein